MQKVNPFLWFNGRLEEAMQHYTSIFKDSRIVSLHRAGSGEAFSGVLEIHGQTFMLLNGGPHYSLTPAFSIFVNCDSQDEVDELWEKLCEGGAPSRCGWLTDKFGLSWQIIPKQMHELLYDPDPAKAKRVMDAMMQMGKIELDVLRQAHEG